MQNRYYNVGINVKGGIFVDWNVIKAEYIAGGTSYRKLAEKYGTTKDEIARVAKSEGWVDLQRQARDKTATKMVDAISVAAADNAVEAVRLGNNASMSMLRQIAKDAATGMLKDTQITAYSRAIEQLRKNLGIKDELSPEEKEINVIMGEDGEDYSI